MAQLALVLGGVRSGKSRFAEQLATASPPVIYLAMERLKARLARRVHPGPPRRPLEALPQPDFTQRAAE